MFDRICAELNLGALTSVPVRLSGGFTHRMFRLDTTTGSYAVKLLNPEIMQRPDALDNYRTAEHFEAMLEAADLPILPAKMIGGRKLQCVDGQYQYVFDYFDGRVLPSAEITTAHCAKMGEMLARIHAVDRREAGEAAGAVSIDWAVLAENLLTSDDARDEGDLLRCAVPMLVCLTGAAEDAARRLPRTEALCHNDMDPKNVLWQGDDFRIIDLECLSYASPAQELLDLAIAWGGADEPRFKAFVSAYYASGGSRIADAAPVYDSRRNYIDWLAYNAERALSADTEERRIAREQIRVTLEKLKADWAARGTILQWMADLN